MPIVYPLVKDRDIGTICGIDPGSNMLGLGIIRFNLRTLDIVSVQGMSFKSEPMMEDDDLISITQLERTSKINAQQHNLVQYLSFFQPFVVICENPFINRFRPNAFAPLVEVVYAIRTAVRDYNPVVKFITYEPSVIKKAVGAGAIAGKEAVKAAILSNTELNPNPLTNLSDLDEHALDAIAAAYTHLQRYRKE
jgi:Holliday junction resolvasome RuvABC endonuclease subunit